MLDWIAPLIGREVVYLLDFDGQVTKRWAKRTPFGLTCCRRSFGIAPLLLLNDGQVKGRCYVVRWESKSLSKEPHHD